MTLDFKYHRDGEPLAVVRIEHQVTPDTVLTAVMSNAPVFDLSYDDADSDWPVLRNADTIAEFADGLTRTTVDRMVRNYLWAHGEAHDSDPWEWAFGDHDSDPDVVTDAVAPIRDRLTDLHPEWAGIRNRHGGTP